MTSGFIKENSDFENTKLVLLHLIFDLTNIIPLWYFFDSEIILISVLGKILRKKTALEIFLTYKYLGLFSKEHKSIIPPTCVIVSNWRAAGIFGLPGQWHLKNQSFGDNFNVQVADSKCFTFKELLTNKKGS